MTTDTDSHSTAGASHKTPVKEKQPQTKAAPQKGTDTHEEDDQTDVYGTEFKQILTLITEANYSTLTEYFDAPALEDTRTGTEQADFSKCTECPQIYYEFEYGEYPITFPIDWKADPFSDKSWQLYLHSLRWLRDLLTNATAEDNDTLRTAFAVIDDWITANSHWPQTNTLYQWNDHASVYRLGIMTTAFDAYIKSNFRDENFHRRLLLAIAAHAYRVASNIDYGSCDNHAIMSDLATMQVRRSMPLFLDAVELFEWGNSRAAQQFKCAYTQDGVHREHSPCYHGFVASKLVGYIQILSELKPEEVADWATFFQEKMRFLTHVHQPNGLLPGIGDCHPDAGMYLSLDDISENGELLYSKYLGEKGTQPQETVVVFDKAGWAIFRSDWDMPFSEQSHAVIQADYHSQVHYQRDDTSFVLFAKNNPLIVDQGFHSYNSDSFSRYAESTLAHNLLVVDEKDFSPDPADIERPGITQWKIGSSDSWRGIVALSHPHYEKIGVNVSRLFSQLGNLSFYVNDLLNSDTEHRYTQQYHLAEGAECTNIDQGVVACSWPVHQMMLWFKTEQTAIVDIVEGQEEPPLGWHFPAFAESIPIPVLRFTMANTKDFEFETFISVTAGGSEPAWENLQVLATDARQALLTQ